MSQVSLQDNIKKLYTQINMTLSQNLSVKVREQQHLISETETDTVSPKHKFKNQRNVRREWRENRVQKYRTNEDMKTTKH